MNTSNDFLTRDVRINDQRISYLGGGGLPAYDILCSTHREEDINASVKIVFDRLEESLEKAIKANGDETFYRDEELATTPLEFIGESLYSDAHIHRYITVPRVFLDPSRDATKIISCAKDVYPSLALSMAKELLSSGKVNFIGSDKKQEIKITDEMKVIAIATDLLSIDLKRNFLENSLKSIDHISASSDDRSLGKQVVFTIKNNLDKNAVSEIKDGKSAQLMEILRGFIATSTYSHENNMFDIFNSIDKINDSSIASRMITVQNMFDEIAFEVNNKKNKNMGVDDPSM